MRNRDIDALRHQELVMQLAQTKGRSYSCKCGGTPACGTFSGISDPAKVKRCRATVAGRKRRRSQVSHDKIETNARVCKKRTRAFLCVSLRIFKRHPGYNLPTESFRHGREKTSGRAFHILSFLSPSSLRIKMEPIKYAPRFQSMVHGIHERYICQKKHLQKQVLFVFSLKLAITSK